MKRLRKYKKTILGKLIAYTLIFNKCSTVAVEKSTVKIIWNSIWNALTIQSLRNNDQYREKIKKNHTRAGHSNVCKFVIRFVTLMRGPLIKGRDWLWKRSWVYFSFCEIAFPFFKEFKWFSIDDETYFVSKPCFFNTRNHIGFSDIRIDQFYASS